MNLDPHPRPTLTLPPPWLPIPQGLWVAGELLADAARVTLIRAVRR